MSALTAESLRRHYAYTMAGPCFHRTEQYKADFDAWLAERDAEVEAAVRAQIAADLEAEAVGASNPLRSITFRRAARIAAGGAS